MQPIPVYKAEREAGLEAAIQAQASVAYASLAEPAPEILEQARARLNKLPLIKAGVASHMNLHPFKSILVSVGWNKNDDVFDRYEVWAARATPEDQPINLEHDSTKIRGHITGQYPVNADMERLADDLAVDELPEKLHIVTSGVLYKHYEDDDVKKEMATIIEEMAEAKWYVSMECLLRGFDYAVIDAKGNHHVIPRCDESAFLTKHLRAYGGAGKYQGYKVGRLLRNFSFSGKGLVRKPANPESIILAEASVFSGRRQEISQIFSASGYSHPSDQQSPSKPENYSMNELDLLKQQLASVQAELKTANDEKAQALAALKDVDAKKLADLEAQVKATSEENAALKTQAGELGAELSNTKAKLNEVEMKLATVEAKAKEDSRVAELMSKLGETKENAEKLAKSWAKLSDEEFVVAADYMAEKLKAYKGAKPDDAQPDSTVERVGKENEHGAGHPSPEGLETSKTSTKEPAVVKTVKVNDTARQSADKPGTSKVGPEVTASQEPDVDPNEANAATASLETATPDADASLATGGENVDEKVEATRASIWDFLKKGNYLKHAPSRESNK